MSKNVVVIASGETERRSLPHLLAHLQTEDIFLVEVRIPPGNKALSVSMAERLIKALWFERINNPPDKFVLLVDTDGKSPEDVLSPFREQLPRDWDLISARKSNSLQHGGISRLGISPMFRVLDYPWNERRAASTHRSRMRFRTQNFILSICWEIVSILPLSQKK